ncbi:ion channel [Pigmentiphaga sp. YJ18]|uniref:ion channel n=1 Tax=Pigmentiphaga sp. YJ18 TaxID=3134907 RepID=UPI0031170890
MPAHYFLAIGLTVVFSIGTVALHYEALRFISSFHPRRWSGRANIGVLICAIIAAHCLEGMLFGAGYWIGAEWLGLGRLTGAASAGPLAYIYFGLETFTTQSLGDIFPTGPLRLLASVEPLVGLILIGWSTSFTFILMRRNWRERQGGEDRR